MNSLLTTLLTKVEEKDLFYNKARRTCTHNWFLNWLCCELYILRKKYLFVH